MELFLKLTTLSDEGGGNRKVDGGRDNAKQKFIFQKVNAVALDMGETHLDNPLFFVI